MNPIDISKKAHQNSPIRLVKSFENQLQFEQLCSEQTINSYKNDILQWLDWLSEKGVSINQLTTNISRQYNQFLNKREYKPNSISRKWSAINQFCQFLLVEKHIPSLPSTMIVSAKKSLPYRKY